MRHLYFCSHFIDGEAEISNLAVTDQLSNMDKLLQLDENHIKIVYIPHMV